MYGFDFAAFGGDPEGAMPFVRLKVE